MKFFHLSDLHIGKQLHFYSLRDEQEFMLRQVIGLAREHRPKVIVIAGDIYDKAVPSAEAVALFDWFLTELQEIRPAIPLLLIAGNHDSPRRLDFASRILQKEGIHIQGMPPAGPEEFLRKVEFTDEWGKVRFYLLPFVKPGYVAGVFPGEGPGSYEEAVEKILEREEIDRGIRNVLVTHQFYTASGKSPEKSDSEAIHVGGLDNVDVRVLEPFVYVAMGHMHRPQSMGKPWYRYCGTLYPYSVSEAEDQKTLTMVTLGAPGIEPEISLLPLKPLRKVRTLRGTLEELLEQVPQGTCGDYVSLTLTDEIMPYQPREQLEKRYERILELRVENTRTRQQARDLQEGNALTDPMELFGNFYREIQGQDLTGEQQKLLEELLEQAEEERS
ncbi:MAG TPA: exonuclease SbcCD subunit D [Candidatus Blautia gallistercoris]|uniref:Nuclease SbcCD subunit D n=1 Tax=Candidatus Blautia gallistercoris TaxID=2838490 RepID=A0A9D1WGR5_9FIRM|nr:exonuclease SbcCD subunit D [Candidatus Blautia gallistercoris]